MMKSSGLIILSLSLFTASVFAQQTAPPTPDASPVALPSPVETKDNKTAEFKPPPLKNLRYDEDFSYLHDREKRVDALDRLKFIPLNRSKNWFLTLGGEIRSRYEFYQNDGFGAGVKDENGYLLERFMLHADFRFGKRLRFFTQIKSGLIENRTGGARPTDLDKLDVNQAFADITIFNKEGKPLSVRVGRQEVEFGSSRLVSVREGPNVRQSFDGARIFIKLGKWQFSPSFLKPVSTGRGYFDDRTNNEQTFYGVYAARNLPKKLSGLWVIYASRLDAKRAFYAATAGREKRDTFGVRIAGKIGSFDFNYEFVGQTGKFAATDIRAWAVITDSGYTLSTIRFKPRIAVRFDSTSGDKNPLDAKLQTFNPLFASANAYSGLVSLILPSNSTGLIPSLEMKLTERIAVKFDDAFFRRTSNRDGIYGSPDARRGGLASLAKFVGNQPSAQMVYRINRYLTWTSVYTHFFIGKFLRETPPAKDVNYFTSYFTFKF